MQLDRYDIQILQILQQQGRITKSALAASISLSVSPCWERVKRLEQAGIIRGYGAFIDTGLLQGHTAVLVEVSLGRHSAEAMRRFEQTMTECNKVTDCYATGGGVDYVIKILCDDIDQYQRLIDSWLATNLGIERYYTYIVTKTVKHQPPALPTDSPM